MPPVTWAHENTCSSKFPDAKALLAQADILLPPRFCGPPDAGQWSRRDPEGTFSIKSRRAADRSEVQVPPAAAKYENTEA